MAAKRMNAGSVVLVRGEVTPPHGEVVRIDVRRLAGSEPRTAVLVVHGFKGFKDWGFFPLLCERLAADGHLVVSFNGSRNGIGPNLLDFTDLDAFGRNTISHEVGDVRWMLERLAAGEWNGGVPPEAVGVLGHSRGGGTSIITASEHHDVVASLVTWAAVSTFQRWPAEWLEEWKRSGVVHVANARTGQDMPLHRSIPEDLERNRQRFDLIAAAGRVTAPWLIVHGSEDETVSVVEARQLARVAPDARLEVIEGSGHTFEAVHPLDGATPGLEAAMTATLAHFRRLL